MSILFNELLGLATRRSCRSLITPARALLYPRLRPNARSVPIVTQGSTNDRPDESVSVSDNQASENEETSATEEDNTHSATKTVPWFMEYNKQFASEFPLERQHREPIPILPADSPLILPPLAEYMTQDLVLKDLTLLDLRHRENPWGNNTIMIVCTARSERQLRASAESLKGFLRKMSYNPRVEGLINWENTKVKRRRRRKMIGRANYQVEDDRLNWLFVDVGGDSGLILQLFSEDGRREYALEELWQGRANNEVELPTRQADNPITRQEAVDPYASAGQMFISNSNSPEVNLAFEHYLFENSQLPCLLLYRNRPSVIIGRNQNPWLEADLSHLEAHDIGLFRRYSGGGTVYHDLGNTNYCYMMPRQEFDRDTTAQRLVTALRSAGLDVALNARHDVIVNTASGWKKCSGSAYKISKDRAYAHGTMLLSSNLETLGPALRARDWGIKGNGVESVRSKVSNLGIEHELFCALVSDAFEMDPQSVKEVEMIEMPGVKESIQQLQSLNWKYEQTPPFTQLFCVNGLQILMSIRRGRIESIAGLPQADTMIASLIGARFTPELISSLSP